MRAIYVKWKSIKNIKIYKKCLSFYFGIHFDRNWMSRHGFKYFLRWKSSCFSCCGYIFSPRKVKMFRISILKTQFFLHIPDMPYLREKIRLPYTVQFTMYVDEYWCKFAEPWNKLRKKVLNTLKNRQFVLDFY